MTDFRVETSTGTTLIGSPVIGGTPNRFLTIDQNSKLFETAFFVDVKAYGAVGDGVTDDTTAIQNAINSLSTNGGSVYFPSGVFKCNSSLTWDISKVSIIGNNTTIDFSGVASGYCLIPTSSQTSGSSAGVVYNSTHEMRGFLILGNSVSGVKALKLQHSSNYISHYDFRDISFKDFDTTIEVLDNCWNIVFDHFSIDGDPDGTLVSIPSGGSNYFERLSFNNGTFFNSYKVFSIERADGAVYCNQCSLDYNKINATITSGKLFLNNCWIEGNDYTNYWFDISGNGSLLQINNSYINLSGTPTRAIITNATSTIFGGVRLDNIFLSSPSYSGSSTDNQNILVAGIGNCVIGSVSTYQNDTKVLMSAYQNLLLDGGFETDLSEWYASGNVSPSKASDQAHSGTYSAKFAVNSNGQTCSMNQEFDIKPGQRIAIGYWYKTQGLVAASKSFFVSIAYLDANENTLFSGTLKTITTDDNWTYQNNTTTSIIPTGTVKFRISFSTGATNTTCFTWIDDVVINVIGYGGGAGAKQLAHKNILITKENPAVIFNSSMTGDTDWWMGTSGNSNSTSDDLFSIGTGTTPFSNLQYSLSKSGQFTIGSGEAGVDYDFLKVDGETTDLLMKWYEDEKIIKLNSDTNTIDMIFGNPSSELFTILGIFGTSGISGAGFSSTYEAASFLESKGDLTVLGGSVYAGFYNTGSAVTSGRLLCGFWAGGNDTTSDLPTGAKINMKADGTWTSTSHPTRIEFNTVASGSTTISEVLRLTSWGRVQVGDQSATTAYNGTYAFFPTPDTKFMASGEITSIGTSGSPLDILKLAVVDSFNINPSADSNSSLGVTVYGGHGFNAFATGTHNINGGLDIGAETISIVGAFGQVANKQTSTNTLDGAVGVLFTAAHYGYGGVGDKLFGAIFSAETSDDAGLGSVSGSQSYIAAAKFIVRVSGVGLTTGVSGLFVEPYAWDQGTGLGVPTITNKTAIDLQGTISIKDSDVATASSITNMTVATSAIRMTGSTATSLHGIHADTFNKMIWIYNVSSATVTLKHQSGTEGTAANRIICNTGADVAITTGKSACLWYDDNQSRWIHLINS